MFNHKRKLTTRVCFALMCVFWAVMPAHAAFVSGAFQFGSTSIQVNTSDIIFYTNPGFVPSIGAPNGNFGVLPPTTGSFAGHNGDIGTVKNLTRNAADVPYSFAPTGVPLAIMDFMIISAITPTITFELTGLTPAPIQDPAAVLCTPANWNLLGTVCYSDPGSPFVLENKANLSGGIDTFFNLTMNGITWFIATPAQQDNWTGTLGGSIVNTTIGQNLQAIGGSPGHVDTSVQGSITASVPEPGTAVEIGGALCLLALLTRRFVTR